jgi:hypothetical protein
MYKHTSIADILSKHQIIDYYRYVDDILIVYEERKTNIINMQVNFNAIHPKLKFTIKQKKKKKLCGLRPQSNYTDWDTAASRRS